MVVVVVLIALVLGLALSHLLGASLVRLLTPRAGHARRVMPSLPLGFIVDGPRAAERWMRTVRRAERRAIAALDGGGTGIEARSLAARIHEDEEVVSAALARLRDEVPCTMRVTRDGRMLHDFDAADIAELRRRRRSTAPVRAVLFLLAVFANVGAVWPVVTVLMLAVVTLSAVTSEVGDPVEVGLVGLGIIAAVLAGAYIGGAAMHHGLLRPLRSSPRLGAAGPEPGAMLINQPDTGDQSLDTGSGDLLFGWFGGWSWGGSSGSSSSGSSSSSSSSSGDGDSGGGGIGQAIIILVLVAIIIACLATLVVWLRGLFRAVFSDKPDYERISPTEWVRTAERVDRLERYIPTNDLVGRLWSALRRTFALRRPTDRELGPRILSRARRRGGSISALEIALLEGLDVHEAVEAGARLCQMVGGHTCVVHGELAFRYPDAVMKRMRAEECPDLMAEYLVFDGDGPHVRRSRDQREDQLPVNMVGVQLGHLEGAGRLAAGAWLMALTAGFLQSAPPDLGVPAMLHVGPFVTIVATLCAIGATALATATYYTAAGLAVLGIRRDARRAMFQEIVEAMRDGRDRVDLGDQVSRVEGAVMVAWRRVERAELYKEMIGVAADLDLEPVPEEGEGMWDVSGLRRRFDLVGSIDATSAAEGDPNDIIHEAVFSLDRVSALA